MDPFGLWDLFDRFGLWCLFDLWDRFVLSYLWRLFGPWRLSGLRNPFVPFVLSHLY